MDKHLSFAIGTTVKFKTSGSMGIITAVTLTQGEIEYAVSGYSWYSHSSLEFISYPTKGSLIIAFAIEGEEK